MGHMSKRYRNRHKMWCVRTLIRRDGDACAICSTPMDRRDMSLDHIEPLSDGGIDDISNLQLTHVRCNQARGAMPLGEWLAMQGEVAA